MTKYLPFIAVLCLSIGLHAATIHVPGDYSTISAAVSNANDGDSVIVAPGSYSENIDVTSAIFLVGSGGPAATIIDGSSLANGILVDFNLNAGKTAVLDGFTVTGSVSGAAVQTDNSTVVIQNCIVRDNRNAGIWGDSTNTTVRHCSVTNNKASGVWFFGGNFTSYGVCEVSDCYIANNGEAWQDKIVNNGGGCWIQSVSQMTVKRCVIVNNKSRDYGGGLMLTASGLALVENCTFDGNRCYLAVGDQVCFLNAPESKFVNNIVVGLADSPRYAIAAVGSTIVSVSYSNFWNVPLGGEANFIILNPVGILRLDPRFDLLSQDGYELLSTSPMIDAGDPTSIVPADGGPRIDIGAHELTCFTGDANLDRKVNISDAVLMIGYIFGGLDLPSGVECATVDGNCMITISDAVYVLNYIFAGGPAPVASYCP